jgi:hypothetical protein
MGSSCSVIQRCAHKTEENRISIYAAIGRGVSKTVAEHFPNLQPVSLPKYELTTTVEQLECSWISGHLTVYCTFQAYADVAILDGKTIITTKTNQIQTYLFIFT